MCAVDFFFLDSILTLTLTQRNQINVTSRSNNSEDVQYSCIPVNSFVKLKKKCLDE